MIKVFLVLMLSLMPLSNYVAASNIDSLLTIAKTTGDTLVADALYAEAKAYYNKDIDSSLNLAIESAYLSERLNYVKGRLNAYRSISAIGPSAGENEIALKYINKGLALIKNENLSKEEELKFIINRGASYTYQNELGKALEANTIAYELALTLGLDKRAGMILNNMGILYRKTSEYDKAIDTYKESISLRTKMNDSIGIANSMFNLGATYAKIDSSNLAFSALSKAKFIFQQMNENQSVLECNLALGTAAFDLGNYIQAKEILSSVKRNKNLNLLPNDHFRIHLYLAELEMINNEHQEAEKLLNEISEIEDSEFTEEKIKYLLLKSELLKIKRDYKNALHFRLQYEEEVFSLNNQDEMKFREEMEAKFRNVQKDFEIEQLEIQETLIQKQLKISRQRNLGLGFGMLLLGGLLWSLFSFNKKIRKQNSHIIKVNGANEILLKEIHHRVKNNLQVVSSLLSMQARKTVDENTKEALQSSRSRVQSMSILHKSLYTDDSPTQVDVHKYFSEIIENIQDTYQTNDSITVHLDSDHVWLDVDILVPLGLIVNELITNAFKHAFEEGAPGNIYVSFKSDEMTNSYKLKVRDNGIGLSENELPKKEGSLGSKLIKEFTRRLDGKLVVDGQSNGTIVTIIFENQ